MIHFEVLGEPGEDNALLVTVNTSQSIHRLLFDCGEGVLNSISYSDLQAIDHLFFSHLHMDHVAGFDGFFRGVFSRTSKENHIWGPPETAQILQHRFQGFWWNLHHELEATWQVHDIHPEAVHSWGFRANERFAVSHPGLSRSHQGTVLDHPAFAVQALELSHHGPTIGYRVQEKPRTNIDMAKLTTLGLKAGPWMQQLKNPDFQQETLEIEGQQHNTQQLRETLLVERQQGSIAYITDLLIDDGARARLVPFLQGVDTLVCESQFHPDDHGLALKNHHTTPDLVAQLARDAGVGQLILFHVSQRYQAEVWQQMLEIAQGIFPNTRFADHWKF